MHWTSWTSGAEKSLFWEQQLIKDPSRVRSLQGSPKLINYTLSKKKGKQLEESSIYSLLGFLDQNLSAQEWENIFSYALWSIILAKNLLVFNQEDIHNIRY